MDKKGPLPPSEGTEGTVIDPVPAYTPTAIPLPPSRIPSPIAAPPDQAQAQAKATPAPAPAAPAKLTVRAKLRKAAHPLPTPLPYPPLPQHPLGPFGYVSALPPPYTPVPLLPPAPARYTYTHPPPPPPPPPPAKSAPPPSSSKKTKSKASVVEERPPAQPEKESTPPPAVPPPAPEKAPTPPQPTQKEPTPPPPSPPPPRPPLRLPIPLSHPPPWYIRTMTAPPRMLILSGGGYEAFVAMPPTYDKALALAYEKFSVNKDTHIIRLSCKAQEMQWIGGYAGTEDIFIADNDSFHYACAGKHVARLGVHVYDKNAKPASNPGGGGGAGGEGGNGKAKGGKEEKKEEKKADAPKEKAKAPAGQTADQNIVCHTTAGKDVTLGGKVTGDLNKGPPAGNYLGTLTIEDKTFKQTFVGNQLGPNEVLTKYIVHDKSTARLLFRPRSVRPSIEFLHPEEKSLEVSLSVADWTVTAAYPTTSLIPEGGRHKLRWFLKVQPGGNVEDMLSGTIAHGIFVEMLPSAKARPEKAPEPQDPLIPVWPDVRPSNAWCLPQSIFIPHIDRIMSTLGLPVESRTAMITAWLPGITRHKNIAYRILNRDQLDPSSSLTIVPPPNVMLRIFILFKGIPDSDLKHWENAGILHAEMGLDWRDAVGWTPDLFNEELFRVIEYGAMEVFD